VSLVLWAFLGCAVLYIKNRTESHPPFSLFAALGIKVPSEGAWFLVALDIVLSSVIGAGVVMGLVGPASPAQAISAGLGFTTLVSLKRRSSDDQNVLPTGGDKRIESTTQPNQPTLVEGEQHGE
jgi:hypothetical protein